MPYVLVIGNRYVCEHSCARYHYGDQTVVRSCCMADYAQHRAAALRVAMTREHPSYQAMLAAWNSLTDAERTQVERPFTINWRGEIV